MIERDDPTLENCIEVLEDFWLGPAHYEQMMTEDNITGEDNIFYLAITDGADSTSFNLKELTDFMNQIQATIDLYTAHRTR